MNTLEKSLFYPSIILVIASAALRIFHVLDIFNAHVLMTFGFVLGFVAYGRYTRRLKARTEELEEEVRQLRSAQF